MSFLLMIYQQHHNMNLYNGEVIVSFDEASHKYLVNGENVTSVTNILSIIEKPFLTPWALKIARDFLHEKWRSEKGIMVKDLDSAKSAYKRVRDEAGERGTQTHKAIEHILLTQEEPVGFIDNIYSLNGYNAFVQWYNQNDIIVHKTEDICFSRNYNYIGTADLIFSFADTPDIKHIGDFKTSNRFHKSYWKQTSAYRLAKQEELGGEWGDDLVLMLDKDTGDFHECWNRYSYETDKAWKNTLAVFLTENTLKSLPNPTKKVKIDYESFRQN